MQEITTANIYFSIWGLKCFYETFVVNSVLKISAEISPHRKAIKH